MIVVVGWEVGDVVGGEERGGWGVGHGYLEDPGCGVVGVGDVLDCEGERRERNRG